MTSPDKEGFFQKCEEAREYALSMKNPLIVHHYDADGLSSGAITISAFKEENRQHRFKCIKKLDDNAIDGLMKEEEIIFVDLGGGNPRVNELKDVLIIDHHQTKGVEKFQVNPLLFGIDGGEEISAAGAAYCVFRKHIDLAIVGAIGDMQYPFKGMNKWLVEEGEKLGEIKVENDLSFYGRYSRPLTQFLLYSDDPYIPGLSFREERVAKLLSDMNIPLKDNERLRTYSDLSEDEKKKVVSSIASILVNWGNTKKAENLIGESYILLKRDKNTETYEANEFSTLLNACGRHNKPEIGIGVCLKEEGAYKEAYSLLQLHRRMLKEGIEYATKNLQDFGKFYFLDGRGKIDEGIVGIVSGMIMRPTWKKPIFGVSKSEKGTLKFSVRSPRSLELNAGLAIKEAALEAGGSGGGHRTAAGASIPEDKVNQFLVVLGKKLD